MRILLIEDNPGDARLIQEMLKESRSDFTLSVSERLGQALKLLLSQEFDVVLLDLNLPDSSGLAALKELHSRFSRLPIVVLTSINDEELAYQAIRFGAQDYLVKGQVSGELMRRVLIYAIERKRAEELLKQAHDELEIKVAQRTQELVNVNQKLEDEISRRKQTEAQINTRNALLNLLSTAAFRQEYLDGAVKLVKERSGLGCVGIRLLDEQGRIPYQSYAGFSKDFWKSENQLSVESDQCVCIRIIKAKPELVDKPFMTKGGSFYCNDTLKFLRGLPDAEGNKFRGVCVNSGLRSVAVFPIRHQGRIIGAIHMADKKPGRIEPGLREFFEEVSEMIGQGVHKFNLEDKIRKEHSLLDAFFSHSISPFVFLDREFNFIRVNKAYAQACKRDVAEFVGHNHFEFYPDKENEAIFRRVIQTKIPHQAIARPFVFPEHPEWGLTYWDWRLAPILDENGEIFILVFSLNDVTEQKRQEEKILTAQKELEQAHRLADIGTLAATVAHELRNPLAAIRIAAFNLKRKAQNPLLDRHLDNIETKVSESDQIINNLLFYSRIKQPHYENINLFHILDECVENARKRYSESRASVKRNYKILRKIPFEADPLQMKELFENILNNAYDAIEGKPGARIEVGSEAESSAGRIKVYFRDSGAGIDEQHLKHVHEPFFSTKTKGTGLGLTVCFQIARLHNADINIESKKGAGTTVTVTLPLNNKPQHTSQVWKA